MVSLTTTPFERLNLSHVRIGIHTGLVVIGEIGGDGKYEHLALGETPNIAARVQGLAPPDTIVISASTYRRVGNAFACRSLGVHSLKGIPHPLEILQVEAEQMSDNTLQEKKSEKVALLVGRTEESEFLRQRWARVKERQGQVVLISGEPGIGKSRLVRDLCQHVTEEEVLQLQLRCSPYHQNSALHPVIEFFSADAPDPTWGRARIHLEKIRKSLIPLAYRSRTNPAIFGVALILTANTVSSPGAHAAKTKRENVTSDSCLGVADYGSSPRAPSLGRSPLGRPFNPRALGLADRTSRYH